MIPRPHGNRDIKVILPCLSNMTIHLDRPLPGRNPRRRRLDSHRLRKRSLVKRRLGRQGRGEPGLMGLGLKLR
jgi:hypothetical protein